MRSDALCSQRARPKLAPRTKNITFISRVRVRARLIKGAACRCALSQQCVALQVDCLLDEALHALQSEQPAPLFHPTSRFSAQRVRLFRKCIVSARAVVVQLLHSAPAEVRGETLSSLSHVHRARVLAAYVQARGREVLQLCDEVRGRRETENARTSEA